MLCCTPKYILDASDIRLANSPVDILLPYPIIYRVLYIPTGAGFFPSCVEVVTLPPIHNHGSVENGCISNN